MISGGRLAGLAGWEGECGQWAVVEVSGARKGVPIHSPTVPEEEGRPMCSQGSLRAIYVCTLQWLSGILHIYSCEVPLLHESHDVTRITRELI